MMRLQQLSQAIADLDQMKRGLEIEKGDILSSYKIALQEKRQLENEMQNMGTLRQKSSLNAQKLNERVAELSGQINAYSVNESRYAQERDTFVSQIEELNDELIKAQRNYEAVQVDSRRLSQVGGIPVTPHDVLFACFPGAPKPSTI
jgi:seryl-tRNA synthetase